jgi:hypothetical protein
VGNLRLSPDEFLELSQGEINIKMIGYSEERDAQIARDWQLAQLIMIGYHDPKKYPTLEKLLPKKKEVLTNAKRKSMIEEAGSLGIRVPG